MEGGIVIAEVRPDDETFMCEDSCIYANDGQCDSQVINAREPEFPAQYPLHSSRGTLWNVRVGVTRLTWA